MPRGCQHPTFDLPSATVVNLLTCSSFSKKTGKHILGIIYWILEALKSSSTARCPDNGEVKFQRWQHLQVSQNALLSAFHNMFVYAHVALTFDIIIFFVRVCVCSSACLGAKNDGASIAILI